MVLSSSFYSLVSLTAFRNRRRRRRRTIHSILSLVARFSRPVQNITTTFACLVACPRYYCCFSFLFSSSFSFSPSLLSLVARCSERKRVQSAQTRARVRVHARPRALAITNVFLRCSMRLCVCVCCSSLKSISRPSLCSGVLSLFFSSLQPYAFLVYTHIHSRTILTKK